MSEAVSNDVPVETPRVEPTVPTGLADPIIRRLVLAFLAAIALFLAAIILALVFGYLRPAVAPRTILERNLQLYGGQVKAGGADPTTWARYVGTLIDAGQLTEARKVLNEALDSVKTQRSELLLQQARLEFSAKNYRASAQAADAARLDAEAQQTAKVAELTKKGIRQDPAKSLPASWLPAMHQKGDALALLGDTAEAIEAYSLYLDSSPTDATILVARGELELGRGDRTAAEADFRAALRYIPDYQPALDGLKTMGVAAK